MIIRKDCHQLLSWNDGNGQSGLDYVLALVARILGGDDESGGLFIGELIIHLFRRAGESVLPVLPQLLEALIGRMAAAETATFLQVRKFRNAKKSSDRIIFPESGSSICFPNQ